MSLASTLALHRASRLLRRGLGPQAALLLGKAMDKGDSDPRLAIQKANVTGDYSTLQLDAEPRPASAAASVFAALAAAGEGRFDTAEGFAQKALERSAGNMTAAAIVAVARFRQSGKTGALASGLHAFPHASLKAQALILLEVEQAIAKAAPQDTGASEREDITGGVFGRIFSLLDDLAIWIYWLISVALNLVLNATNSEKRKVYWKVIEGDRLEGLGKTAPAIERFTEALALWPDCPEALESMVKHNYNMGDLDESRRCLSLLVASLGEPARTDPSIGKWDADLAFAKGDRASARLIYESLEPQFPQSYIIPYRLGLCALSAGAPRLAAEKFEHALEQINPGLLNERVSALVRLCPDEG